MSYTYDFTTAPLISQVRMLVPDTGPTTWIFNDAEVNQAIYMESSQGTYASGQSAAGASPIPCPVQIYSVRRAAALLVDITAGSNARLAIIVQLLDVKLDASKAAAALRDYAKSLRDTEAMSGAFAIAEWVLDPFTARERVWKQMLRLYPG